jgi:hypothetical protein
VKVNALICLSFIILTYTFLPQADFQNQGAQELAKDYDPEGKRTIGKYTL